jgi:predicted enzyme related to lactoylglutathione lyase
MDAKPVPVTYFEIVAPDAPALVAFYRSVFGWASPEAARGYHPITTGTGGIGGAIVDSAIAAFPPGLTLALAVPDVRPVLEAVQAHGGTVVVEPVDLPGFGRFAMFADPSGNRIGLAERSDQG